MSEANLRRRITGLERQLDQAWRIYIAGLFWLIGAAGLFVISILCLATAWAIVSH